MSKKSLAVLFLLASAGTAHADVIDLSSWSPVILDYSGGQGAANWALAGDNESVTQTINADPSMYINNLNQTSYSIDGSWQVVSSGGDDDYMGFVFGYQNSSNFYLFDWKAGTQGYVGTNAAEGMTIKKLEGATGNGLADLSLEELWENEDDFGDMTVLQSNHGSDKGWAAGVFYNFHLDFNVDPGVIAITVMQGPTTLWDISFVDNTFTAGQFGFYNYSQGNVQYAGFEQTGGVIVDPDDPGVSVPEPAALGLFGMGLLGMGAFKRRRKA